jgi:hypothetical protein
MTYQDTPKVIACDIDGTLTIETCWTEEQCRNATPRQKVIDHIKKLAKNNFIVFYTARRNSLYQATIEWLEKQGFSQWPIKMGKLPADCYIDDKSINPNELPEL